jgi:hypothetical protein
MERKHSPKPMEYRFHGRLGISENGNREGLPDFAEDGARCGWCLA